MAFVGLWATMFGVTAIRIAIDPRGLLGAPFCVIGALAGVLGIGMIASGGRSLFTGAPRFRATSAGVWFGGGAIIPWTAVEQVFETVATRRFYGVRLQEQRISFSFHRRTTVLRAPINCWFSAPFSTGDIDLSLHKSTSSAQLFIAKLEVVRGSRA
jgi:hypothetical protein